MAFDNRNRAMAAGIASAADYDEGLRKYMLRVYNIMAMGVALTGALSMLVMSNTALLALIGGTPLKWVLFLGILGIGWFGLGRVDRMSTGGVQTMYWVYAGLWGLSLGPTLYIYAANLGVEVILRTFFYTAIAFAGTSLYGYTTKKDLSGMAGFLMIGMIGVFVAAIVNWFVGSTMLQFVLSAAGVLVFAGLTAWETQQIKTGYDVQTSSTARQKGAIVGAFVLYASFVGIFIYLLQIFGIMGGDD